MICKWIVIGDDMIENCNGSFLTVKKLHYKFYKDF